MLKEARKGSYNPAYFYQIEFKDGRIIRRERVTKKTAQAVYDAMVYEMNLFNVESIEMGLVK